MKKFILIFVALLSLSALAQKTNYNQFIYEDGLVEKTVPVVSYVDIKDGMIEVSILGFSDFSLVPTHRELLLDDKGMYEVFEVLDTNSRGEYFIIKDVYSSSFFDRDSKMLFTLFTEE